MDYITFLFIIVVLILLIIIGIMILYDYTRNKFWDSLVSHDICEVPPAIEYRNSIYMTNKYEKKLAEALIDVSFAVTISNCPKVSKPLPNPAGFTRQKLLTSASDDKEPIMNAYIFYNTDKSRRCCFVFSGTFYKTQWINNFNCGSQHCISLNGYTPGMKIHSGFYKTYMELKKDIDEFIKKFKPKEIFITGHSLGGALATICGLDLHNYSPLVYSFASPRVGNNIFASTFNELLPYAQRIENSEDIITDLPPPILNSHFFTHTNNLVSFTCNLNSIRDNHSIAYRYFLP